jgi:DNA-binding transcriptional ArsR family regulator
VDRLSDTFAALADPTRRAILARLVRGETSVTELAQPFAMSLPAVSKHLKVLEKAGLVSRGRDAQWRPVKLDAGPLKDVTDWLEPYRQLWEERFDRLEAYLAELEANEAAGTVAPAAPADAPDAAPSAPATPTLPTDQEFDDGPYR